MTKSVATRRKILKFGAAASALPWVHVRTAAAAGKLSIFFWDHWVPAGNDVIKKQVATWADKNKVDVSVDFITSNGFKNLLTINAEAQAKTGHDVITIPNWEVQNQAAFLEPVDDVVKRLEAANGRANRVSYYLGQSKGSWLAVPSSWGTQNKGPCGRISLMRDLAGLDLPKMYPASATATPEAAAWTYEAMLKAAEACHKGGKTFGIGLGVTADSVDTAGAIMASYGAELIDAKGQIAVKSDAMRQVLEYAQRLVKFLPADAVSYDDASNNRALISGQSALICNPPSAWAVAVRDAPAVGADSWTFPAPQGPKGRFMPHNMNFWGIWKFSPNKTAGKELVEFLMGADNVAARSTAVLGYDLPPYEALNESTVWDDVGPPKGTVYNYPVRKHHNMTEHLAMMPAPPDIAVQAYNRGTNATMFAKLQSGQTIKQVTDWAAEELEGFTR